MLRPIRLQSVGRVCNVAVDSARNTTVRSHSTHSHGHNCDHGHAASDSHPRDQHPVHTHFGTSPGPASAHPPLDPAASKSASESCQNLVFKRDYESFLTSKFYPTDAQNGFFALKAFYVYTALLFFHSHRADFCGRFLVQIELATIQDHVTQPIIGKMRMQFWRDAVKSIGKVGRSG